MFFLVMEDLDTIFIGEYVAEADLREDGWLCIRQSATTRRQSLDLERVLKRGYSRVQSNVKYLVPEQETKATATKPPKLP